MKPKICIFTTPNQEYNVLFENFEGPFRHYDHKFEWTRAQFQDWVQTKIIDQYPEYKIERFDGIGEGPGHIGHCSQYVVIVRKDFYEAARNGCFDQITLEEDDNNTKNRSFVIVNDNILEDGGDGSQVKFCVFFSPKIYNHVLVTFPSHLKKLCSTLRFLTRKVELWLLHISSKFQCRK